MALPLLATPSALALWWSVKSLHGYQAHEVLRFTLLQPGNQTENKAGPRWTLFIDSGVPERTYQSSVSHWASVAISSSKCYLMTLPAKLRIQQVNTFRIPDIPVWSHTSCLYYSQCRNTFLASLYELSSTPLYLNSMNSLRPVWIILHSNWVQTSE